MWSSPSHCPSNTQSMGTHWSHSSYSRGGSGQTHQSFLRLQKMCLSPTHRSLTPQSARPLWLRSSSTSVWLLLRTEETSKQHRWERQQRLNLRAKHRSRKHQDTSLQLPSAPCLLSARARPLCIHVTEGMPR